MRRCIAQRRIDACTICTTRKRSANSKRAVAQDAASSVRSSHDQSSSHLTASESLKPSISSTSNEAEPSEGQDESLLSRFSSTEEANIKARLKRLKPRPRRPLPLSPLMDPSFDAARHKHEQPKARPPKHEDRTPFQQSLYNNPYAQALATPLRRCKATKSQLPRFFLLDFELMNHPETRVPWWLPSSLAKAKIELPIIQSRPKNEKEEKDRYLPEQEPPQTSISSPPADSDPTPTPSGTEAEALDTSKNKPQPPSHTHRGPRGHLLSSAHLLSTVLRKKGEYARPWEHFPTDKQLAYRAFRPQTFRWREDMETFVLELMRRRASERLALVAFYQVRFGWGRLARAKKSEVLSPVVASGENGSGTDTGVEAVRKLLLEELQNGVVNTGAAVLWLGHPRPVPQFDPDAADVQSQDSDSDPNSTISKLAQTTGSDPEPGEFATLDLGFTPSNTYTTSSTNAEANTSSIRHNIPVHNLPYLLGATHLQKLKDQFPTIFNPDSGTTGTTKDLEYVILRKGRQTPNFVQEQQRVADALLWLWRLQGYLARYGYDDMGEAVTEVQEEEVPPKPKPKDSGVRYKSLNLTRRAGDLGVRIRAARHSARVNSF